jgi:16S rRNA (guanine527-N7)-methyltransferase
MSADAPAPPPPAGEIFGERLPAAEDYAALLADTGVSHGLIGPREVPRLWDRHMLNCAVVAEAFPAGARVIDVGSGAGLPGIALAIARPDLEIHLVEPMLRRVLWLREAVAALGLEGCTVERGRAEELAGGLSAGFVTARAVARIDKLARWSFPLLQPGGALLALKGSRAAEELEAARPRLRSLGMAAAAVRSYGDGLLETPTVVLELRTSAQVGRGRAAGPR